MGSNPSKSSRKTAKSKKTDSKKTDTKESESSSYERKEVQVLRADDLPKMKEEYLQKYPNASETVIRGFAELQKILYPGPITDTDIFLLDKDHDTVAYVIKINRPGDDPALKSALVLQGSEIKQHPKGWMHKAGYAVWDWMIANANKTLGYFLWFGGKQ